jgi:phosphoribosylformimino-5-aminoimidazole carboxamide ribotide isomerase
VQLIPSIDLRHGRVVRLEKGNDARSTVYPIEPLDLLERFAAAGVERVHVVDLDAAFGEAPQEEILQRIAGAEVLKSCQLGGGLRSVEAVDRALGWGFDRVVVGSMVARDPDGFAALVTAHAGRIVPALDCAGGVVRIGGWLESCPLQWNAAANRLRGLPCPAVLVTDVERDGMLSGPNLELAAGVARESGIPAILSGGVSSAEDLARAAATPEIGAAILGRAYYEGRVTLADALAAAAGEARP